jgi:hypothetical protein
MTSFATLLALSREDVIKAVIGGRQCSYLGGALIADGEVAVRQGFLNL